MDDFPDLVRDLTPTADSVDPLARARLRDAFGAERRRVRREWFLVRAVSVGVVMFLVWSIAPATPTDDQLPLIGLAQATAQLPAPEPAAGEQWYVREEREERMSIVDNTGEAASDIAIMVNTVSETWVDLSSEAVSRSSVSVSDVISPQDRDAFERLQEQNPEVFERVDHEDSQIMYSSDDAMWSGGANAVYAELERAAGKSDDIRMDRLTMLGLASNLMQRHGVDPTKRSLLLLTIARIPGIEVESADGVVQVRYQYVVGDIAHEVRYDFDSGTGALAGKSIATMATPTSESIVLSRSRYEARLAINDHEES